jgi:hypothetical protein
MIVPQNQSDQRARTAPPTLSLFPQKPSFGSPLMVHASLADRLYHDIDRDHFFFPFFLLQEEELLRFHFELAHELR